MEEKKRRSWVKSILRNASKRWPARTETFSRARIRRGVYACNACHGHFVRREVVVDHIDPVVPVTGWDSWDGVINRMFCDADGMQMLCKQCHKDKTAREASDRRLCRKQRNS